jgi:VanZ family protein
LAILVVSSLPGQTVPTLAFVYSDKVAHFAEYAILGVLLARLSVSPGKVTRQWYAGSLAFGLGLSALDELHQLFIPNRVCAWSDFFSDALGVGAGMIAYALFRRKRKRE